MNHLKKYKIEDESFGNLSEDDSSKENIPPFSNSISLATSNLKQKDKNNNYYINIKAQTQQQDTNNISEINFTNLEINDESMTQNNNSHHVHIIDEDVENFKRRLDIMIKNFRTDTLKDFMNIKRNLLVQQKNIIECERQKCEELLNSKGNLVEHLKEDLAKTRHDLNSQVAIKENICQVLFKDKYGNYEKKLKQKAFLLVLKKYHDKKKDKKYNTNLIRKKYHTRLKEMIFTNLKQNCKERRLYNIVSSKENEYQDKLKEITQYYGKEIADLKYKLQEANKMIEKTKEAKNAIQENLKKVLMKGVMAMNMEAMSILDKEIEPDDQTSTSILNPLIGNKSNHIEECQSFSPSNMTNQLSNNQASSYSNDLQEECLHPNPIIKDINSIDASVVPNNIKTNLLDKESYDEINMEIHDTNNDFNEEEVCSRKYNLNPMNPVENRYKEYNPIRNNPISSNYQKDFRNNLNKDNDYYDDMQKNLSSIKNDFSAIKQNSGIDDSFDNSSNGLISMYFNQQNVKAKVNSSSNYDIESKLSKNPTVSNTYNIVNQQLLNNTNENNNKKNHQNNTNNNINNNSISNQAQCKKSGNRPNCNIPTKPPPLCKNPSCGKKLKK